MKKARIGRRIMDVIDQDEFIRRSNTNPEIVKELAEDTAVQAPNGMIYPIQKQHTTAIPGVYDAGPMLLYNTPESMKTDPQYQADNIIDFENVSSLKESIAKQAELEQAERTILISPENIFTPIVQETDTPEMALLKKAIARKNIDLESYKQRFGSDYNNDKRIFEQPSITFFKMKRVCDIFDIKVSLTLEDNPGAANPIGERLSAVITRDKGNEGEEDK
jgi:ribosomal protein S17E